jgi:hypothetical protein
VLNGAEKYDKVDKKINPTLPETAIRVKRKTEVILWQAIKRKQQFY